MKNIRLLSFLSFFVLAGPADCAQAQVLATVGGEAITYKQVAAKYPEVDRDLGILANALKSFINEKILLDQAQKMDVQKNKKISEQVKNYRNQLLMQEVLDEYVERHPVAQQDIEKKYQELVRAAPKWQYRIREIIVPSYQKAHAMMDDLRKGASFSQLAAGSDGPNAALGGELGWVNDTGLDAPILQQLEKASIGSVVGPINLPSGWGLVQLLGKRRAQILPLQDVEASLKKQLEEQEKQAYIQKLWGKYQVHISR
ncbi:MAG: peptidylprolyl isomerase [Acidithiobacillus sp.]|nr:peptidylprolyl isomerase [Acidithiobacillus sp.]